MNLCRERSFDRIAGEGVKDTLHEATTFRKVAPTNGDAEHYRRRRPDVAASLQ